MKKIFLIFAFFLIAFTACANEIPATNRDIANASPGDHIIRADGERVVLQQSDIDYARQQLELQDDPDAQDRPQSRFSNIRARMANNIFINNLGMVILLIVTIGLIVTSGKCVSNITAAIAKNSGMDDRDTKKVGISAGVLALIAATITAAALFHKYGGISAIQMILRSR